MDNKKNTLKILLLFSLYFWSNKCSHLGWLAFLSVENLCTISPYSLRMLQISLGFFKKKTGKISRPAAKVPHFISSPNQPRSRSCTQSPVRGNYGAVSCPAGWQHGSHAGGSQPSLPATSCRNDAASEISWSPALQDGSHRLRAAPSSSSDI